jgi:methionine-R-sulfoxide reductase
MKDKTENNDEVVKSDAEWKQRLTPMQYHVLRRKGTERPFTGKFVHHKEDGTYVCAACGQELFHSDTKFDSGSGWPSFWDAVDGDKIELREDFTSVPSCKTISASGKRGAFDDRLGTVLLAT